MPKQRLSLYAGEGSHTKMNTLGPIVGRLA